MTLYQNIIGYYLCLLQILENSFWNFGWAFLMEDDTCLWNVMWTTHGVKDLNNGGQGKETPAWLSDDFRLEVGLGWNRNKYMSISSLCGFQGFQKPGTISHISVYSPRLLSWSVPWTSCKCTKSDSGDTSGEIMGNRALRCQHPLVFAVFFVF